MKMVVSFLCLVLPYLVPTASLAQASAFAINYDAVRKSVVFIYAKDANGVLQPDGTGFLIRLPTKSNAGNAYLALVTARHMVDVSWTGCQAPLGQKLVARFNKKDFTATSEGAVGTVDYELPTTVSGSYDALQPSWFIPRDNSADVAFTLLDFKTITQIGADYAAIAFSDFARPDETKLMETGSQIVSAGLFPGFSGNLRNYPVFKFGYVSSKPNEKIAFKICDTGNTLQETAWTVAASLVPGNSGSPVFYVPLGSNGVSWGGGRTSLIGIQSSARVGWDVAGIAPIDLLAQSMKNILIPDADFSGLDAVLAAPTPK